MLRIRTWWHATLLGLNVGTLAGATYGGILTAVPGVAERVWLASLPLGWALLGGAVLGLCYGAASGTAGGITLAVDARIGRPGDTRTGLEARASAALAAAIGVVVAFLVIALAAWLLQRGFDLSDLTLLTLVGVPALFAAGIAVVIVALVFDQESAWARR